MARRGKRTLVRVAMGLLSTLAGGLLVLRPFASESLLVLILAGAMVIAAVAEAVQGTREAPARWILGGMYLAGATILVAWPHIPLIAVGVVIGLLLVATGMLEIWSGLISTAPLPSFLVGAAVGGLSVSLITGVVTLIFGLVSGLWVDAVSFPMSLMLGTRMLLVGIGLLTDVWYPPTGFGRPTELQRVIGRLIALALAAALIAQLARDPLAPTGEPLPDPEPFVPDGGAIFRIAGIILLLLAAFTALDTLGYRLTSFIFIVLTLLVLGVRNYLAIALVAVALSFGVFHSFYYWLKVPLPIGGFGL